MKAKLSLYVLLVVSLILAAVPACSMTSSPAASSEPSTSSPTIGSNEDPEQSGDLGSITYTLDTARQVSETFDFNTGKDVILTAADANGYGWMLSIPASALSTSETITMTPFATMDASQSEAEIVSGVQLEPDGLQFVDAVRLSVTAPTDNPGVGLIFSMQQDGTGVDLAPTTNTTGGRTAIATIWHFSAAGYTNAQSWDDYAKKRDMAEALYWNALDAAKEFLRNPPRPPVPPAISLFCRGTEVNPEGPIQADLFEFRRAFFDPYDAVAGDLVSWMAAVNLLSNLDTSDGMATLGSIFGTAEKQLTQWSKQAVRDKPPDRLVSLSDAGMYVFKREQLLRGSGGTTVPEFEMWVQGWAVILRDYYLGELKTKHDYRAFPALMDLEKNVALLSGNDRLGAILSAMTFEVVLDTSFDGTWTSSGQLYATGHAEQHADVFQIESTQPPDLWAHELELKVTSGSFKNPTGTYPITGQTYAGGLWLTNWDACVTKSFDVELSGFSGVEDTRQRNTAGAASRAAFEQYWWDAGFFMFTVPIKNLDANMGDQTFTGSGSAGDGAFTGSGKIHIVLKHTP